MPSAPRTSGRSPNKEIARGSQVRLWSTRSILDRDGCDLLPERETQHRAVEEELGLERPFDGLGLAEAVAFAREWQVCERQSLTAQCVHQHLGLGGRDDLVVESLEHDDR